MNPDKISISTFKCSESFGITFYRFNWLLTSIGPNPRLWLVQISDGGAEPTNESARREPCLGKYLDSARFSWFSFNQTSDQHGRFSNPEHGSVLRPEPNLYSANLNPVLIFSNKHILLLLPLLTVLSAVKLTTTLYSSCSREDEIHPAFQSIPALLPISDDSTISILSSPWSSHVSYG